MLSVLLIFFYSCANFKLKCDIGARVFIQGNKVKLFEVGLVNKPTQ